MKFLILLKVDILIFWIMQGQTQKQLFHGGIKSPQKITGSIPLSASELNCDESFTGKSKQASDKDIKNIIEDFTTSAIRCYEAGFDGLELHGAHGYLISQFMTMNQMI